MHRIIRYNLWRLARIGIILSSLLAGFLIFSGFHALGFGDPDENKIGFAACIIVAMSIGFLGLERLRLRMFRRRNNSRFRHARD
jgi:hypothetical protein